MPRPGPRTTPRYSDAFKATAVRLSQLSGIAVQDVAESLYIHPFMLSRWRKQTREGQIVTRGVQVDKDVAAELKELRKLKKAHERLRLEHEIFKKAIEFTSARRAASSPSSGTPKPRTGPGDLPALGHWILESTGPIIISGEGDRLSLQKAAGLGAVGRGRAGRMPSSANCVSLL